MDPTRKPLGIIGMVYEDYGMLKRWFDYYSTQVGAENLFLFSHGNDPLHRAIAPGANVINVPRDPQMKKFDIGRWKMLGDFASGMLNFYNWMLVTDIDEFVVVDPDVSPGLVPYLRTTYPVMAEAPRSISLMGLNITHIPEEEPDHLTPRETILSKRRYFYPSRVYSKPTLVRQPVQFGPGGHRNNLGLRTLSDDLYLLHMKWADVTEMTDRSSRQVELVDQAAQTNDEFKGHHVWRTTVSAYNQLREELPLGPEDIKLTKFRQAMLKQQERYTDRFIWGDAEKEFFYQLPKRFAHLV